MALDIPRLDGRFEVISDYKPSGDQPAAIDELERRVRGGDRHTVLMGATGTGKSATTAWLIERVQRPTLVLAHNKTLCAQLAKEFRELLPNNAVEYFVSYYDYYQPEAYIPQTDTYIEKDSDRKSTRLNSSHLVISYAVFCLKKKTPQTHPARAPTGARHAGPEHEETAQGAVPAPPRPAAARPTGAPPERPTPAAGPAGRPAE